MLLPSTDRAGCVSRAERLLGVISEFPFKEREHQPLGHVSVSIGVACFPEHAHDKASLISTADAMLYQAKRTGRGRVCAPADLATAMRRGASGTN